MSSHHPLRPYLGPHAVDAPPATTDHAGLPGTTAAWRRPVRQSPLVHLAALAAAAGLSGCGSGEPTDTTAAATRTGLAQPLSQPSGGGARPGIHASSASGVAATAEPARYDARLLLDWAERTYPAWFPGPAPDQTWGPYTYRSYGSTGNAVGVAGNDVAVLGPVSGGLLLPVGTLADFECRVLPGRCNGPSLAQRSAAAGAAAQSDPACVAAQPFHWSVGDAGGRLAEGSVGSSAPQADTEMAIASASKWLWGAYVAERRNGTLTADDVPLLNFTSGYTQFSLCLQRQTVAECQAHQGPVLKNGGFEPGHVGRFNYSGGHMQKHAVLMGLGDADNGTLARAVGDALGIALTYSQPQLAGGVVTSATQYGQFLQAVVAGRLKIAGLLGRHAVCTNPATCPTAVYSPIGGSLSWDYAVGHWVETDPASGDGAFSSAGAFGFYPWVDAGRSWWGIVARHDNTGLTGDDPGQRPARDSAACGARIRAAWLRGQGG